MYFMMLLLLSTVENTFDFILSWVPFWSWMRFFLHLYLILPGSQGATFLYQEYVEPFLYHHEREIDDFITDAHERARSAGLAYVQQGIEWVKVNVMGFAPRQSAPQPTAGQSYAQNFMSRFNMPAARGSDNLYSLVNQALSGATAMYAAGNRDGAAAELSRSAHIIPDNIRNTDDRLSYVSSQRERLQTLLQAFDQEADNVRAQREAGSRYYDGGGLSKSRSEAEFDRIERDEIGQERPPYPVTPPALGRRTSSGWMPWNWQRGVPPQPEDPLAYGKDHSSSRSSGQARSTGFDLGDR
jgi:receptor expression-enhancing protein 1/2/3/4